MTDCFVPYFTCVFFFLVTKVASEDILLDNLKTASSSYALLDEVNKHRTIMNANHVVQALKSLFILQKNNQ